MDVLDDLESTYMICLVLMISFNLMFNDETTRGLKSHFVRRTRKSASGIMHELGNKPKNYHRAVRNSSCVAYHFFCPLDYLLQFLRHVTSIIITTAFHQHVFCYVPMIGDVIEVME